MISGSLGQIGIGAHNTVMHECKGLLKSNIEVYSSKYENRCTDDTSTTNCLNQGIELLRGKCRSSIEVLQYI